MLDIYDNKQKCCLEEKRALCEICRMKIIVRKKNLKQDLTLQHHSMETNKKNL